jgi:hypothetical protein
VSAVETWKDAFGEIALLLRRNPDAKLLLWPTFELGRALAHVEVECTDAAEVERMRFSSSEIIREARYILSRE